MSGAKRKSHYRKSVTSDYVNSYPEPESGEAVCKVVNTRGSNMFELLWPQDDGSTNSLLAVLPNKFKNVIWVKRNDFVIVEGLPISTEESQGSSGGGGAAGAKGLEQVMIKHILQRDQINHLKKVRKWPEQFNSPDRADGIGGISGGGQRSNLSYVEDIPISEEVIDYDYMSGVLDEPQEVDEEEIQKQEQAQAHAVAEDSP